jgi:hypothetical protein
MLSKSMQGLKLQKYIIKYDTGGRMYRYWKGECQQVKPSEELGHWWFPSTMGGRS